MMGPVFLKKKKKKVGIGEYNRLALHTADLGTFSRSLYGSPALPGVIPVSDQALSFEHSWVPSSKNKKKMEGMIFLT